MGDAKREQRDLGLEGGSRVLLCSLREQDSSALESQPCPAVLDASSISGYGFGGTIPRFV